MKKLVSLFLAAVMLLASVSALAAGNYTDEMKFDDGIDLSADDSADSVERLGDHADSPYFNTLDFYNMASTDRRGRPRTGQAALQPRFADAAGVLRDLRHRPGGRHVD